jgi:hypothetical protein
MTYKMKKMCAECPFHTNGKGLDIRCSLAPGRWREILVNLLQGGVFWCHQTVHDVGDGSYKLCAGGLKYQAKCRVVSMYEPLLRMLGLSERRRRKMAREHQS